MMRLPLLAVFFAACLFTVGAVAAHAGEGTELDPADVDKEIAPLPPPPYPADNPYSKVKSELGKLLYFDPKLGGDASISCADCHNPKQGWGFSDPMCRGYPGGVHWRNCHTTVNSGYLNKLFWHGSATSLEKQAKSAAQGGISGNGEVDVMVTRLRMVPRYVKMFKEAFGSAPTVPNAYQAIATFERDQLSEYGNNPLDDYLGGDKSAFSKEAQSGFDLFKGKANCVECHNGPMLTDEKYYNIGVPRAEEWAESGTGMNQITFRFELYAKGFHKVYYDTFKDDAGLYFTSKRKSDMGKFRTAPLRYMRYSAPYMHAGQFYTLEEVIDFYNEGGGENEYTKRVGNKTSLLKPLGLSDDEKAALVAFLTEISGSEISVGEVKVPDMKAVADAGRLTQQGAKRAGLPLDSSGELVTY